MAHSVAASQTCHRASPDHRRRRLHWHQSGPPLSLNFMHGLNIAFFGSSLVSAYWNGAATYYRGLVRALHERGHRVTFYEPDAFERQQHRDMEDPDWARVVVYPAASEQDVCQAVEQARGADLVVKASGVGVYDELL